MYNHEERKETLLKYFAGHLDALFLEGGPVLQHLPATDELQHLRALPHQLSHLHPVKRQSHEVFFMGIQHFQKVWIQLQIVMLKI
jgi:hypothetical protein